MIQGKSQIASIYARKCEIGEEGDNTTEYNLPDLYEKHLVVDGTPIELNVFDLPGAPAPRAVKSRTNIYPQSVSFFIYIFESSPHINSKKSGFRISSLVVKNSKVTMIKENICILT